MATLTLNPDEPQKNDILNFIYNIKDKAALSAFYQLMKNQVTSKNHAATQAVADDGDSKEYILAGWDSACKELRLIGEGKIQGRSAKDILNEL